MQVEKKKKTTEALQWTDEADVQEFEDLVRRHSRAVLYVTPDYGGKPHKVLVIDSYCDHKDKYRDIYLYHGEWLLIRSDGKATVLDDEIFKAEYEEKQ